MKKFLQGKKMLLLANQRVMVGRQMPDGSAEVREQSKAFLLPINLSLRMQATFRVQKGILRYSDASRGEEPLMDLIDSRKYLPIDAVSNGFMGVRGVISELLIEKDPFEHLVFGQLPSNDIAVIEVKSTSTILIESTRELKVMYWFKLLGIIGGVSVVLYCLLWLLSQLCVPKSLDSYLIEHVLKRPKKKD